MSEKGLDFFTGADKNRDGKNASEYPAWMHQSQMDELRESIRQREHALDNDLVYASERMIQRDRLKKEKEKLGVIEESKPKLEGPELDRLVKARKYLGGEITKLMYSHSEMERGTADAHEEARRMTEPCVSIKGEDVLPIIKACGVDGVTVDCRISRNQAEKCWKILSAYLGEPQNTEVLRKEK